MQDGQQVSSARILRCRALARVWLSLEPSHNGIELGHLDSIRSRYFSSLLFTDEITVLANGITQKGIMDLMVKTMGYKMLGYGKLIAINRNIKCHPKGNIKSTHVRAASKVKNR